MLTEISNPDYKVIHNALFNKSLSSVEVRGEVYPIKEAVVNGEPRVTIRFIEYTDPETGESYRIQQQNPLKYSTFAQRAAKGEHLTWVMYPNKEWILITD